VDLQERHQLDVAARRMKKVRAKARPWRYLLALALAIAGAVAAEVSGVNGWGGLRTADQTARILFVVGATAFLIFGMIAAVGLSARVRSTSQQLIGQAHAGILRYVLVLVGVFAVLTIELAIAKVDVKQLLVGGAVTGVLIGIAAQQALANLFAGLVLLFAHPFRVGDHVRFRAGALSGQIEGVVIDISLTYVKLETSLGPVLLPNSQALAAAVLLPSSAPVNGVDSPDPNAPVVWPEPLSPVNPEPVAAPQTAPPAAPGTPGSTSAI
jgi:small-conductance mechanosensitive channel